MKLKKKKDYDGTIRKVCSDGGDTIGVLGTVEDFMKENIISGVGCLKLWCFIPFPFDENSAEDNARVKFAESREELLRLI